MIRAMGTSGQPCGGILVVDDDPDIRDSLREVLEDEGYEVACVGNGREALDHLKTANPRPCVILLDLMMPVMDGWQFRAEQLREPSIADVPVVCVTAVAEQSERIERLRAPCLRKPVEFQALLDAVENACGSGS
jgi:CheY-like chemotaxis protein